MKFITLLICFFCLWLGGFVLYVFDADFYGTQSAHLQRSHFKNERPIDAIIVLTGDRYRIRTGFHLLQNNAAPKLLISGVQKQYTKQKLMKYSGVLGTINPRKVFIDFEAKTTAENAFFSNQWIQKNNVKTILLVTSTYHMRRSLVEFESRIPDLEIIPFAINPLDQGKTPWSKSKKMVSLYTLQYTKYLVTLLKHKLSSGFKLVKTYL